MNGETQTGSPVHKPAASRLPYGLGRVTPAWLGAVFLGLALLGVGLYAYFLQFTHGEEVTGMRDWGTMGGAPWGLYIVFVVYFIGVSFAGITIAALIRLFRLDHLKPVARIAELLTVITIVLGALSIVADLGQPGRGLVNLFRYARPQSPFFGTFTLVVSGYLFASLVYLFLDGRKDAAVCAKHPSALRGFHRFWASGYQDTPAEQARHSRASLWLAVAILPLLVTAHSTLGFVFGLQIGRPGWFSALQAPAFVILAGVSGIGLLLLVAALLRSRLHLEAKLDQKVFGWLGKFLLALTLVYVYFMAVEVLTTMYAGAEREVAIMQSLLVGRYAPLYWTATVLLLGSAAILIRQAATGRWNVGWLAIAGIAVNVAAILKRYLIVVPSLTSGGLMPYGEGSYAPTWVEYGVEAGLIGAGILAFAVFMKVFPILPVQEKDFGGGEA